ncbi:serine/threonine-protein phosphatase [Frigoribacterium sp. CFBP 8759]|jgi:protein phosphatase|uniref:PP2C family protein-serine/threonine phosphatase n=1 Tax=Frigoribacterium TaxID=96492 RepID=UPI0005BCF02B|nr:MULTISPECIES: PP2C family serine/threonine-protein phosphatase [Frigoribacterium]KIU02880.1 protein phosphatase [Frigoribacterium sp. MEB024]MBD8139467.1 serine/threonine-protein phosphatase [Frigoribacterium sp. CFBP 13605]MBD8486898.1 serine/threonine-protein phosphatase [Frigoribacterium sp. CFBP 8759]MBD8537567.1 serine/threonine-protein phosphatase [Frigoribacterium sp. CFBP 8751]NQW87573.1 serine/threonine-protein phosphatase [Frigoribacterium sp. VKM Ac-2860]
MTTHAKSAALSNVGKIRSNNQDSGYAGTQLFVVADGMGGHAGGDVASAIAIRRIRETDRVYTSPGDAEFALQSSLIAANQLLAETVFEHQELTGMGTTVSAMLRVGDSMAIAHIGDSRIYLFREGELSQITADHTFVQRLVDSGRITPEEAAVHPRRSVLMRVLGDVDAAPEIDTATLGTQPGDRWLICSDGLSSYLAEERIKKAMAMGLDAEQTARRLVKETLDHGAPDNVTVVIVDVDESGDSALDEPVTVGSAAAPLSFDSDAGRKQLRLPTILLHPLKVATTPEDSHFEPESDEYLAELIAEDKRRRRRRRITWLTALVVAIAALVAGLVLTYQWTQDHYYVGEERGTVVIYKGVQQSLGPIGLSSVYETTDVQVDDLPNYTQTTVEDTINAGSLADARAIVERLADASNP